jgi:hypothetical protein
MEGMLSAVTADRMGSAMRSSGAAFGLTGAQWEDAKSELRQAILDAAYNRRMTWYGECSPKVTTTDVDAHSALMNHLLGAVFQDEHDAGRPLLTAIVTHKDGDKEPGDGFYDMARSLGYSFDEPFVFWSTQVQEVFKLHGRPERRSRRTPDGDGTR